MLIDELPLPLLPGGHIPPHHLQWDHHHVPGGVSRQLEVLSHWVMLMTSPVWLMVVFFTTTLGSDAATMKGHSGHSCLIPSLPQHPNLPSTCTLGSCGCIDRILRPNGDNSLGMIYSRSK